MYLVLTWTCKNTCAVHTKHCAMLLYVDFIWHHGKTHRIQFDHSVHLLKIGLRVHVDYNVTWGVREGAGAGLGTGCPIGKSHEVIGQSCCSGQRHTVNSQTVEKERTVPTLQFKRTRWREKWRKGISLEKEKESVQTCMHYIKGYNPANNFSLACFLNITITRNLDVWEHFT